VNFPRKAVRPEPGYAPVRRPQGRGNGLDKPFVEYATRDMRAEHDILARNPSDARAEVEHLLVRLRSGQGRYSTPGGIGEAPSRPTPKGPTAQKKLLDIHELEEIYGLKHWTVRTLCSQSKIPHIKIGRRVFFDPAAIDAWIAEHARPVREVDLP
jgi:predicted DNA-binding transcriptional regulator AlpA